MSWNNHDTDDSVFELYIKVFPVIRLTGSQRAKGSFRGSRKRRSPGPGTSASRILSSQAEQKCGILCVQTRRSKDSPYEHFSFDGYNFREWGNWHHLVLTHDPKHLLLYIDGELVQSCSTLNYPLLPSSTDKLTGYIGRRGAREMTHSRNNSGNMNSDNSSSILGSPPVKEGAAGASLSPLSASASSASSASRTSNARPFCGQVSKMHFIPGLWSEQQVHSVYQRGLLWDPNPSSFLSVRPEDYILDATSRDSPQSSDDRHSHASSRNSVGSTSGTGTGTTAATATGTGLSSSDPSSSPPSPSIGDVVRGPLVGSIQDKNYPPGVVAHATNALQRTLADVAGVKMPLAIMDK